MIKMQDFLNNFFYFQIDETDENDATVEFVEESNNIVYTSGKQINDEKSCNGNITDETIPSKNEEKNKNNNFQTFPAKGTKLKKQPKLTDTNEKSFYCEVCLTTFNSRKSLK